MITESDERLLDSIQPYEVIINICNAKGWIGAGMSKEIRKRWPKAFDEYREYCAWFRDGHEDEILGTFVGAKVKPDFIVCYAIAQQTVGKATQLVDYDAFDKICAKVAKQTHRVNKLTGKCWKIHALHSPNDAGCDQMMEAFQKHFGDSDVELVIHKL